MNSLYQQLGGMTPQMASIRDMMNAVKVARDPNAAMQTLMRQNPQVAQVMQVIQQNGGDPKTAFYNTARQKGVDPEQILSMLR